MNQNNFNLIRTVLVTSTTVLSVIFLILFLEKPFNKLLIKLFNNYIKITTEYKDYYPKMYFDVFNKEYYDDDEKNKETIKFINNIVAKYVDSLSDKDKCPNKSLSEYQINLVLPLSKIEKDSYTFDSDNAVQIFRGIVRKLTTLNTTDVCSKGYLIKLFLTDEKTMDHNLVITSQKSNSIAAFGYTSSPQVSKNKQPYNENSVALILPVATQDDLTKDTKSIFRIPPSNEKMAKALKEEIASNTEIAILRNEDNSYSESFSSHFEGIGFDISTKEFDDLIYKLSELGYFDRDKTLVLVPESDKDENFTGCENVNSKHIFNQSLCNSVLLTRHINSLPEDHQPLILFSDSAYSWSLD